MNDFHGWFQLKTHHNTLSLIVSFWFQTKMGYFLFMQEQRRKRKCWMNKSNKRPGEPIHATTRKYIWEKTLQVECFMIYDVNWYFLISCFCISQFLFCIFLAADHIRSSAGGFPHIHFLLSSARRSGCPEHNQCGNFKSDGNVFPTTLSTYIS